MGTKADADNHVANLEAWCAVERVLCSAHSEYARKHTTINVTLFL
jgi:hypothetical protein